MPTLVQSLQPHDLGHLRIVAGLWGVELAPADHDDLLLELSTALLGPDLIHEMVNSLSVQAQAALERLVEAGGKIAWAAFARQFGEIRETGPGRRDREQLYLHPVSIAELLFYRAFLARGFFDTPNGAQEFAYIPDDLLEMIRREFLIRTSLPIPSKSPQKTGAGGGRQAFIPGGETQGVSDEPLGRSATSKERQYLIPATDRLLDDATTFLAALRMGLNAPETLVPAGIVNEFLKTSGIVLGNAAQPEQVKSFLEMSRLEALGLLTKAWRASESLNELRLVPGLVCEGEWTNQPHMTREFLLHLLEVLQKGNGGACRLSSGASRKSTPISNARQAITTCGSSNDSGWNLPARFRKLGRS